LIALPISIYCSKKFSDSEEGMMTHKDERVKVVNEMLLGIRVVKFFTWESEFKEKIDGIRSEECRELRNAGIYDSSNVVILRMIPIAGSVLTFLSFVFFGGKLEISKVFSVVRIQKKFKF
jgi:ATP-binding cassette, subfamily C (CFTR/MRP), member 10